MPHSSSIHLLGKVRALSLALLGTIVRTTASSVLTWVVDKIRTHCNTNERIVGSQA